MNPELMTQFLQALQNLYHPDPLGAVARGNSRPGGLTPQSTWDSMFTPTSPERQAQMTNHPMATMDQMANAPGNVDQAQAAWNAGHGPFGAAAQPPQVGNVFTPPPLTKPYPAGPPAPTRQTNPLAALFANWF